MGVSDAVAEHVPVLLPEVIAGLDVSPGDVIIDGTVGLGGHAEAILRASAPDGRLLGLDVDPLALGRARERLHPFGERVVLARGNFAGLEQTAAAHGFAAVDGLLLDLGVSSLQLGAGGRGFSFQHEAALDMRMDPSLNRTAADFVNGLSEAELAGLLFQYGEEPRARRIAGAIVRGRPLSTTTALATVVRAACGGSGARMNPATRTFQALRIAVNGELERLPLALAASLRLLRPGGRLAVISFHSLEDRIVKQFLREQSTDCICPPTLPVCACSHRATLRVVTHRAITPSTREIAVNSRSRSARLRVAEILSNPA